MNLENMTTFQEGELARRLFESGETNLANAAIYNIGDQIKGEKDKDIAEGYRQGTFETDESIKKAAEFFSARYHQAMSSATVNDLSTHYNRILRNYLTEEEANSIRNEFSLYSGETYGDIIKNVARANYVLEGLEKGLEFSEEEIEAAEVTMAKYDSLRKTISLLENIKFENLRPRAANKAHKTSLKGSAGKLEKDAHDMRILRQTQRFRGE